MGQPSLPIEGTCPTTLPRFSLVQGGPLFQLYRRLHLSGESLDLTPRRALWGVLFTWLPLLILSWVEHHAIPGSVTIPFLSDIEIQSKFLVALPALIIAEPVLHVRLNALIKLLVSRGIIARRDLPKLRAAIESALRVRNWTLLELILVAVVYTLGTWVWRGQHNLSVPTWYANPGGASVHLTLAGYWDVYVSNAFFQLLLLRWYARFAIWFRLLWQISKMNLHLTATHPDRAGGIGFLGRGSFAFGLLLFSQGVLTAGVMANRVLLQGQNLMSFKMEALGYVVFYVFIILSPLLAFTPRLQHVRRRGKDKYGSLASQYVYGFENKWIFRREVGKERLLGTPDIQSLADLANSYAVVHSMRLFPFGIDDVMMLAIIAAAPLLPLALTVVPLETLVDELLKLLLR